MSLKLTSGLFTKDATDYPFRAAAKVATLTLLKAETTGVSDGNVRLVPGYGFYRYDASSTATADDFAVLTPDTLPGRWLLIGSGGTGAGLLNVENYAALQAVTPAANMTRGVLGFTTVGDGGYGVFMWIVGDTTADDGQYVLESTVVGYRPGEAGGGRWHKVVAQVGIIAALLDIATAHPGIYSFLLLDIDDQPALIRWHDGDTTTADSATVWTSAVSGYGVGEGAEGRWKLSRTTGFGFPVNKCYIAEIQAGSGGASVFKEIFNNTGEVPTFTRAGAGIYDLEWATETPWTDNKSVAMLTNLNTYVIWGVSPNGDAAFQVYHEVAQTGAEALGTANVFIVCLSFL